MLNLPSKGLISAKIKYETFLRLVIDTTTTKFGITMDE